MDDLFAQYYEDLLRVQYRLTEEIQQKHPRGTIREDFLRDIFLKRRESLRIRKGTVCKNRVQSRECDLLFYDSSSPVDVIGEQIMIEPSKCKLVLEVKSNADSRELKKTDNNFQIIKNLDPEIDIFCGIFCYNTNISTETAFKKFGFIHDAERGSTDNLGISPAYPYIDFIINVASYEPEETCTGLQFFFMKDQLSGRYNLRLDYPIIQNLIRVIDAL